MFRKQKIEVIPFREFMAKEKVEPAKVELPKLSRKQVYKMIILTGALILSVGLGDPTLAAASTVNGVITDKVVHAFDPLVLLIQALSYPIGLVMALGGGLFIMIGNSDRGLSLIQNAGFGYIVISLLPTLMDLLVEITKAL